MSIGHNLEAVLDKQKKSFGVHISDVPIPPPFGTRDVPFIELDAVINTGAGEPSPPSVFADISGHPFPHAVCRYITALVPGIVQERGRLLDEYNHLEEETDRKPGHHGDVETRRFIQDETTPIVITNFLPREETHNESKGTNGNEFVVGVTRNGVLIYASHRSHLAYLEAMGHLPELYTLSNEIFGNKQWRSRRLFSLTERSDFVDHLTQIENPPAERDRFALEDNQARLAGIDGFGNPIIIVPNINKARRQVAELAEARQSLKLKVGGGLGELMVRAFNGLETIPNGVSGIYFNYDREDQYLDRPEGLDGSQPGFLWVPVWNNNCVATRIRSRPENISESQHGYDRLLGAIVKNGTDFETAERHLWEKPILLEIA